MIPWISFGFFLVCVLLAWFVIYARGWWWVKSIVIIFVPIFFVATVLALDSFSGWPTAQALPARSFFRARVVIEPNQIEHQKGAIYLWLIPIDQHSWNPLSHSTDSDTPRAYKEPYSRGLHEAADRAAAGTAQKRQMILERVRPGRKRNEYGTRIPKNVWRAYVYHVPTGQLKGS